MKFSRGDKVVILVDHPPYLDEGFEIAPNTIGTIVHYTKTGSGGHYSVRYNTGAAYYDYDFYEDDLDFAPNKYLLPPPEFDLEDIELAEIIIKELKNENA